MVDLRLRTPERIKVTQQEEATRLLASIIAGLTGNDNKPVTLGDLRAWLNQVAESGCFEEEP